ncbi:hypothetical protein LINPERPRIM_LOCUS837 [Linum perenne]
MPTILPCYVALCHCQFRPSCRSGFTAIPSFVGQLTPLWAKWLSKAPKYFKFYFQCSPILSLHLTDIDCNRQSSMAAPVFEFDAAVVAESQLRFSTSLLARLFLPNPKPRDSGLATLVSICFSFFFSKKADMDRVVRRRPHSIDGCLVNLLPWKTPSLEVFDELRFATFWVHLEEVPSEFRSLRFGVGLLQPLGQVLHTGLYDSPKENKEFIRGFVRIDVTKPFLGRRKARFSNGGEF